MSQNSVPPWPDRPALFLDLDGTVLEFERRPAEVHVPERLRAMLDSIHSATGGALAFISGRTLADLDRLLGAERFPLAAVHGLERRDSSGRLSSTAVDEVEVSRIRRQLEQMSRGFPGTFVEDKGLTLALHYRSNPELEHVLLDRVERCLRDMSSDLMLMPGNCVLEVKPATGDKGKAIMAFMQEPPFSGRTPVFVGDDVTDEDGFKAVNSLRGISVKVASGPTCASFRLADTRAVIDWLEQLAERTPA